MIEEYLYEMIALIVALTLIVIYFLTRKFKQDEENFVIDNNIKVDTKLTKLQSDPVKKEIVNDDTEYEEDPFSFSGSEEGSFGDISHNPFEEIKQDVNTDTKNKRTKVDVPKHGKIFKDNFKEFKGVKLLVAEDNLINQKVINGLLADSGIEVTMADDGQIALDILENNSDFNMVLMDAHMPRIDGFEATRQIRANPNYEHIVVVALSGDTAADDIRKMTEAGMEEQLEKPLRMDAFYDILYAYTKNDIDENEFVEVIMTEELDGDKGLEICGGDELFYKDILNEFKQNYSNTSEKLNTFLNNKEIASADALLLDFIGVTANIGADNIKNIAQELKDMIKDTEEKNYNTLLEAFDQHLQTLLKDIKRYN